MAGLTVGVWVGSPERPDSGALASPERLLNQKNRRVSSSSCVPEGSLEDPRAVLRSSSSSNSVLI